jgi:hypothetical protein
MTPSRDTRSPVGNILLIIGLLGLILTSIFLSRRSLDDIQESSSSIYKDRLVPTGMIVNLTATVYRKRLLLENYLITTPKPDMSLMTSMLNRLNRRTDSLLTEFEQTKLTAKEAGQLQLLKQRLAVYNQLESELTTNLTNPAKIQQVLFTGSGNTVFGQIAQTLDELASLQITVGQELVNESRGQTNYIYVLTALQIGLVLVIGLILFWHRL